MSPFEEVGRSFVDAFNRRDADALVALAAPDIDFQPTVLVGAKRAYRGHEGLRRWVAELAAVEADHRVRVREIRPLAGEQYLLLSEVLLAQGRTLASAMLYKLSDDGRIAQARAYLTNESLLASLGHIPVARDQRGEGTIRM